MASAAVEAARSDSRGRGWAASNPASPLVSPCGVLRGAGPPRAARRALRRHRSRGTSRGTAERRVRVRIRVRVRGYPNPNQAGALPRGALGVGSGSGYPNPNQAGALPRGALGVGSGSGYPNPNQAGELPEGALGLGYPDPDPHPHPNQAGELAEEALRFWRCAGGRAAGGGDARKAGSGPSGGRAPRARLGLG